jgi:hypothetical protein
MKTLILTIFITLLSLISNSQTVYFGGDYCSLYVLDSLSIPYIPMDVRTCERKYSENNKKKFVDFFGSNFSFIPIYSFYDMSYESFVSDKKFIKEDDDIFNFFMIGFDCYVVNQFSTPIKSKKYKSIWIVEIYCKKNDTYTMIVMYEDKSGLFEVIHSNSFKVPIEFSVNEPDGYKD